MAYEIIGNVHKIGATENIQTKSGSAFQRRSLTLIQRRFDQNTGEEFEPNFPTIDFTRDKCMELDKYKPGDRVRIRFDVSGAKYIDRNTSEEKYFNSLRGFRIEPYVQPNAQQQEQPPYQPPQPQNYAPAGQWQQPAPQPQNYAPAGQWQQPAPQPQNYAPAGQWQQPAPQPQNYAPAGQWQQPAPQPQNYAPAGQWQQPAPQPQGYAQQPPLPTHHNDAPF